MSLTNESPEVCAINAKSASLKLATLPTDARNHALKNIHAELSKSKDLIIAANARDLKLAHEAAKDGQLSTSLISRLDLSKAGKWDDMLRGIMEVHDLEDPGELRLSYFKK